MKTRIALFLVAALAVSLAPVASRANHCVSNERLYIFSWLVPSEVAGEDVDAANLAYDLGSFGCRNSAAHADTNYIAPQSDTISVAARVGGPPCYPDYKPASGTYKFDSGPARTLFWSCDPADDRWESQQFKVPPGTGKITVTAKLQPEDLLSPAKFYTSIYSTTAVM